MSKRWINTRVEYQWSDELGKLEQISKEGYWYEGEMTLAIGGQHQGSISSDWQWVVHNTYGNDSKVSMAWGEQLGMHITVPNCNDDSYMLHLHSNNGTFQVKGNGYVGIGVTASNILYPLHMKISAGGDHLAVFEDSVANANLTIKASAANKNTILNFADGASDEVGQIDYDHNDNSMLFKTNASEAARITSAGNVGIGDTSPSYKLEVTGTFYSSGSSIEYKQDVEPYTPPEGALMSLKPVQYQYKDAWKDFGKRYAGNSSKQLGLVAEDVAKVLPELAVTKTEDGKEVVRNVDYEKLTVLLVSEVQNLRKELNEIKGNSGNN